MCVEKNWHILNGTSVGFFGKDKCIYAYIDIFIHVDSCLKKHE